MLGLTPTRGPKHQRVGFYIYVMLEESRSRVCTWPRESRCWEIRAYTFTRPDLTNVEESRLTPSRGLMYLRVGSYMSKRLDVSECTRVKAYLSARPNLENVEETGLPPP
jgi:hypothetical protein